MRHRPGVRSRLHCVADCRSGSCKDGLGDRDWGHAGGVCESELCLLFIFLSFGKSEFRLLAWNLSLCKFANHWKYFDFVILDSVNFISFSF